MASGLCCSSNDKHYITKFMKISSVVVAYFCEIWLENLTKFIFWIPSISTYFGKRLERFC